MSQITIRLAAPQELDEVFRLRFGVFLDPTAPCYFTGYERFRASGTMRDSTDYETLNIIALDGSQIVGSIAVALNGVSMLADRKEFQLDVLENVLGVTLTDAIQVAEFQRGFVLSGYRGRGIFRQLLRAADEELRRRGGKVAFGAAKSGNSAILNALTAHGWSRFATTTTAVQFDYLAKVI